MPDPAPHIHEREDEDFYILDSGLNCQIGERTRLPSLALSHEGGSLSWTRSGIYVCPSRAQHVAIDPWSSCGTS